MKRHNQVREVIFVLSLVGLFVFGYFCFSKNASQYSASTQASQTGTTRSVRLNNYNDWHFVVKPTDGTLASKLETLSKSQEITYTEAWDLKGVTTTALKNLNPNIKLYRLYTLNVKPTWDTDWSNPTNLTSLQFPLTRKQIDDNNWWMRDGNGNVVQESASDWFVDVGKPGVKEAFLASILDRNRGKGFDGLVFDYWWPGMVSNWITGKGLPVSADYPNDAAWFNNAWKPFLDYVMAGMENGVHVTSGLKDSGYKIIGNCAGEYSTTSNSLKYQRSLIDGTVYEQGSIDWPSRGGNWLSSSIVNTRINSLRDDPLDAWIGTYGLRNTDPLFDQKKLVDLALYYVSLPDDIGLQSKRSYHYYNDGNIFWDPLWDFYIGHPSKSMVKDSSKYFWTREYSVGLVLLNYESSNQVSYNLGQKYIDSNKIEYSGTVTLDPHTALILRKVLRKPLMSSVIESNVSGNKKYQFSGTAEPGSDVVVHIHSDPIDVSTTADGDGNWSVEISQSLSEGDHSSYVTSVLEGFSSDQSDSYNFVVSAASYNDTVTTPKQLLDPSVSTTDTSNSASDSTSVGDSVSSKNNGKTTSANGVTNTSTPDTSNIINNNSDVDVLNSSLFEIKKDIANAESSKKLYWFVTPLFLIMISLLIVLIKRRRKLTKN